MVMTEQQRKLALLMFIHLLLRCCSCCCSSFFCHANSNGMLNVYLRRLPAAAGRGGQVAGRGSGHNYFVAFCTLQMMQTTPHAAARQRVASLSLLSLLLSLSVYLFLTQGNWKLVERNISCLRCPLPLLKLDCIRRGRRQLGMLRGIKQHAAQRIKKKMKGKMESRRKATWKAACFNCDIAT